MFLLLYYFLKSCQSVLLDENGMVWHDQCTEILNLVRYAIILLAVRGKKCLFQILLIFWCT